MDGNDYFNEEPDEVKELINEETQRDSPAIGKDFEKTQKTYNGRWTD